MVKAKRKIKGYWTTKKCENCIKGSLHRIPVGFKPKGIVKSFIGESYEDVNNKLRGWKTVIGKYYIYIEQEDK